MKPSLRFLAFAVIGWAAFRAISLGLFRLGPLTQPSEARPLPPIVATQFPPVEPAAPADSSGSGEVPVSVASDMPPNAQAIMRYLQRLLSVPAVGRRIAPIYQLRVAVPASPPALALQPTPLAGAMPMPPAAFYSQLPPLDRWPLSGIAGISHPASRSDAVPAQSAPLDLRRIDRLQLTMWALLRSPQTGLAPPPSSLASGGQLGGSQAGLRLTYNFMRQIAASLRATTEVGRRGGELAAGTRLQPFANLPVWITAERRQQLGKYGGGRNAFALFFEGGVYDRPMPARFSLDAYLQGGVVGLHSRERFIDGALTLTRPVYRNFSAGLGVWGGAQPGLYRIDAGPRLSVQVRRNVRVHFDWRQRLAGNALPGSGPAVTLAGNF
jgi:hypothetical protein